MLKIIQITDPVDPALEIYASLKENQLYRYFEPEPGLFLAESPKVIERALQAGYSPFSLLMEPRQAEGESAGILRICEALPETIPLYLAESGLLCRITGYGMTRGALCAMRRRKQPDYREIKRRILEASRLAVLENVVNPSNVGAVFRSAAALGADMVLLTEGCADPLQRRTIRVSMGNVFLMPWAILPAEQKEEPGKSISLWPEKTIGWLRENGFHTIAMALDDKAVHLSAPRLREKEKTAVILGTEGEGLKPDTIRACDDIVYIPMFRGVDSLNAAAAAAVAFWQLWHE